MKLLVLVPAKVEVERRVGVKGVHAVDRVSGGSRRIGLFQTGKTRNRDVHEENQSGG
jgi:hypothetical protein